MNNNQNSQSKGQYNEWGFLINCASLYWMCMLGDVQSKMAL